MKINSVSSSGPIVVHPVPITLGEDIQIHYKGFLANQPNAEIYAHVGYGTNDQWTSVNEYKMNRSGNEYTAQLHVDSDSRLNICFRGSNNQWDNNYGNNWSYEVHNGRSPFF